MKFCLNWKNIFVYARKNPLLAPPGKNPDTHASRDVLNLFKWQNISTKYASLLIHISSKRNSTNGEFLSLENCFISFLISTKRERTRRLDNHLAFVRRRWSCYNSILSHTVFNSLESKGRLGVSLTIFTSFFIYHIFKSVALQLNVPDGLHNE